MSEEVIKSIVLTPEQTVQGVVLTPEQTLARQDICDKSKLQFEADFREYALYTIMNRAVPDIRDGFQPVHRRILFTMHKGGCRASGGTMKSARIVGDVIGKYHPHGDSAVYGAMVRMAQPWAMRYMPVFGQGNFGSIDNDPPAAMRYSEAKLSKLGELAVGKELNMDGVDFQDNYDGKLQEPMVLPVEVPYLLLNGTSSIAVGIAADFVPHNFNEVMNACISVLKKRNGKYATTSVESLVMKHISGPDFPTGGIVVAAHENALREAYKTGHGLIALRAKVEVEQLPKGEWQLVVTEMPYGIYKEAFIQDIDEWIYYLADSERKGNKKDAKKSTSKKSTLGLLIQDIKDETNKNDIRIIIKPRSKSLNPDDLIMHLYSVTDLQVTIKINMNALTDNGQRPKRISLFEGVERFLDFRENVIIRTSRFKLKKLEARLHIIDGLLIAIDSDNADNVIHIIRFEDDPEQELMKKYGLSELQVDAIIQLRLQSLKKLAIGKLKDEKKCLLEAVDVLESLINIDEFRMNHMIDRFRELIKEFGDDRRTEITIGSMKARTLDASATIPKDPATAMITQKGWIKYMKGKDADVSKTMLKEGDAIVAVTSGYTNESIVYINKAGKAFSMPVGKLPSGRTDGLHIGTFFEMGNDDAVIASFIARKDKTYVITSDLGYTIKIEGDNFISSAKRGKQVITTGGKVSKLFIQELSDEDSILIVTKDNKVGLVSLEDFPLLPKGKGNKAISMGKDVTIEDVIIVNHNAETNDILINGESLKFDSSTVLVERGRACKKIDTRIMKRIVFTCFGK